MSDARSRSARLVMRCASVADRLACGAEAMAFGRAHGLDSRRAGELTLCVAELLSNAVRHGGGAGVLEMALLEERGEIEVVVRDEGGGIESPADAMRDGWSRGRQREVGEAREAGAGLGIGLGAVRRLADGMSIESVVGVGTRIRVVKRISARG